MVIVTPVSLFWRTASLDAQTTSERLDWVESEYAIEAREQLYATSFRIKVLKDQLQVQREQMVTDCNQLKETGVPLNETDIYLC